MKSGRSRVRSYLTLEYKFSGIRVIDNLLIPVNWSLTLDLAPNAKKRTKLEEIAHKSEMAYQRLHYWLETIVSNIIAVDTENTTGMIIAATSGNTIMMTPGEPNDDLLVELIHAKLNTLVDNNMILGNAILKGSDSTASYNFECLDTVYSLPEIIEDYVSIGQNTRAVHKLAWWFRNDGYCFELLKSKESTQSDADFLASFTDPLVEFDKSFSEEVIVYQEPAKIIQVEKWKPKKIV